MNHSQKAIQTRAGMDVWMKDIGTAEVRERSPEQRAWDSGVSACAEFVRRVTGNEQLALDCFLKAVPAPSDTQGEK